MPMQEVQDYLTRNAARFEEELKDFLRIASVSAKSERVKEVRQAAQFVELQLKAIGFKTEVIDTPGHPLVAAEWLEAKGAPTILIYGHYDVQPPEPLDLWTTGPFEPTVRDGNLYARGSTDDKGQLFTHIKAVEAWMKAEGRLPVNIKFLVEGEEEIGSKSIYAYLETHQKRWACDYVVISDSSMFAPDIPAITYGLKGLSYFELNVQGPNRDLHSGSFGGSVQNPANALARMLAALQDADGRCLVPGFYDDVVPIADVEKKQIRELGFSEEEYRKEMGVPELFGEKGYNSLERRWARPTCDVNGLWSGYQGEGAKTVLPAKAGAKFSFRLVPHQSPEKIEASLQSYLDRIKPPGVTIELKRFSGSPAVLTPLDSPGVRAASKALAAAFGRPPVMIREGGSIPIVGLFKELLNVDSLLLGYGLSDDNAHSPNEKFHLKDFHRGMKANAYLFEELSVG